MPFNDAQKQMNQAQAARRQQELELFTAKEKLAKLGRAKDKAARFSEQEAAALAKQEKALQKQMQKIKSSLLDAQAAELQARLAFKDFSDPRKHLSQLSDDTPILLFPLRIETRFKTLTRRGAPATAAAPAAHHELWVRVYPDDIAVDGFEPLLSESEAKNAASYFAAIEAAGDDEGLKRAAWRSLAASHGSGRAHWIVQNAQPQNGAEPDTKLQGWTQAPKTHVLPERLVLMAFNNGTEVPVLEVINEPIPASLAVGPDPSLDESEQIRIEDGNIVVNPEMKWMVNFEEALEKGMGFRIPLTPQQAQDGFDKLYVLGVKLGTDSTEGKQALEILFDHHHHSRKGFGLLRQGTPTNNTDTEGAEYSWQEDTDESFDHYFPTTAPSDPTEWETKKDGRTLAEMLGIDAAVLQPVRHYYHTDMAEAKAMHHALWPATLGYFMENMMEPVFPDATIRQTRDFFCRYVSGRGAIPAIRVGKQPYGILPATPFRRMQWLRRADKGFMLKLYSILQTMSGDWDELLDDVAHIGKDGDPHQLLLDIVGLHPSSVEFYSRNAQSFEQLLNTFALKGLGGVFIAALIAAGYVKSGMNLLEKFGYTPEREGEGIPDMLQKFFFDRGDLLKGPIVDDVPLSETEAIRDYTDDGRNYIEWLIDAANTSHNALRAKQGFTDNKTPSALLFLMLHHALDLGYVDTSLRLHVSKEIYTPAEMVKARQEPKFIHIQEQNDAGSRWKDLYKADARITGDATLQLGDFIATIIPDSDDARQLRDQLDALDYLKNVPTARLERIFAEHLDLCTYRLDAWIQGLVHYQLDLMRHQRQEVRQGIYLGAYGLLENVRPENKVLTPVQLEPELEKIFADPVHPLTSDSTNGGYIHAPSTNHAVTAAVLRNGYIENASAENSGSFAVNLTSNRVRLAMGIIEGMQSGQSLAALLGYQLERGLHDNHTAEVDEIIYNLRLAFPLRSNRMKDTQVDDLDSIDTVEARNVVDALSLIEHIRKTGNKNYPFGHSKLPANLSTTQKQVIDAEVERILNINDAVADLAIAESVHQVVQGNYDRASATLDTYSKGNFPPTPDVIKTPRSGFTLTHRVGLQLETGLNPAAAGNTTPRSKAEPAVNKWLASLLPSMDALACKVEFTTPAGITQSEIITLAMLGFLPIDALYMVSLHSTQAMASLDDAFTLYVLENFSVAPDSDIKLLYTEPLTGKVSLHEVAPLLHSLQALLQRSRPLNASDVSLMHEGTVEAAKQNTADKARITLCRTELNTLKTQISNYANALSALLTPEDANLIMPELDAIMPDLAKLLQKLAFFGLPQAGSGFIFGWQQTHFRNLSQRLETFLQRQQERLDSFDATMAEYAALPGTTTDAERYTLLQTAERFISTKRGDTSALTPAAFRNDLLNVRKPAFEQWLSDALDVLASASLSDMYAALLPVVAAVPDIDTETFALTEEQPQLLLFAKDLLTKSQAIRNDLQIRLDAVDTLIVQHDAAATAPKKVTALLEAGKLLLGEDFKIVPEFALSPTQATEWQSAYNDQPQLLSHQTATLKEDFPIDNWLYGIARVREKMGHVEKTAIMAEALADKTLALEPVQLPYRANDSWLALEYPDATKITEDKLLYTAHYAAPFDSTRPQCGLLLDEWTEVIPGTEETTGLTFHYDRPNTEPPQTLLLATPADFTGKWRWQDLVDTLHDTLDLAKKRAVEPEQIDRTSYARFLPALVSAFTIYPITASLNLALNNQFHLFKGMEDE
ncbi:hypothetical protein [Nitrosomonas sp. Nm166]|uniref:hypothetical protein n=1 Tax=Nitrosomonas sp. Nm166 TaxID=1881054 RepID=UPI0008EC14E4|nr:hypothetical protein [Nitrosomonas sp. Nm166]SFF10847.1 hypothetical protein SAMN05428977_10515 [Nitrosomonas sp. Nm166]